MPSGKVPKDTGCVDRGTIDSTTQIRFENIRTKFVGVDTSFGANVVHVQALVRNICQITTHRAAPFAHLRTSILENISDIGLVNYPKRG